MGVPPTLILEKAGATNPYASRVEETVALLSAMACARAKAAARSRCRGRSVWVGAWVGGRTCE